MTCARLPGKWRQVDPSLLGLDEPGPGSDPWDLSPEDAERMELDGQFGARLKVWAPIFGEALAGWGRHWTHRAQGEETIMYLPAGKWTIVDIDQRRLPGGAPRAVLAEVRTDRGVQWVLPGVHKSALADPTHRDVSAFRGAYGMRVQSLMTGERRILRPGPCIAKGTPGAATYLYLARCFRASGGAAEPLPDKPRRTAECPRSLGSLDDLVRGERE